jgi:hypothetical protein
LNPDTMVLPFAATSPHPPHQVSNMIMKNLEIKSLLS